MNTNGDEPACETWGEARRGSRSGSAGVRAASVFLLSALAASCAPREAQTQPSRIAQFDGGETPRRPIRLLSVTTDTRGVRHYELSDGSALALDPLEPFTETPR